jgi:hypothetical protein
MSESAIRALLRMIFLVVGSILFGSQFGWQVGLGIGLLWWVIVPINVN